MPRRFSLVLAVQISVSITKEWAHVEFPTCIVLQLAPSCHQNIFFIHGWVIGHVKTKLTIQCATTTMHYSATTMQHCATIMHYSQQRSKQHKVVSTTDLNFKSLACAPPIWSLFSYKYNELYMKKDKSLHTEELSKHLFM
jgi:hypothetical protein